LDIIKVNSNILIILKGEVLSKMKKSMKKRKLLFNISIVLLILVTFAIGISQAETTKTSEFKELVFASGPAGGNWYGLGGSIAELIKDEFPDLFVSVMPGGAVGNPTLVDKGIAQIGFSATFLYSAALKGAEPYENVHKNLQTIGTIGQSDLAFLLVREKIPVDSIEEIIEKKYPLRLVTSAKGSSPATAAVRILGEYGITFDDLKSWGGGVTFTSYSDAAALIADGHADANISPVTPALVELMARVPMKWLPMEEEIIDQLIEKYQYSKSFIPKGKHSFVLEDGWTIGGNDVILVNAEVPEEIVYGITKALCENPKVVWDWGYWYVDFDPETAWEKVAGPLHPGAEHYYREVGYMK